MDEAGGENPDKWLDEADKVTMPDALRYLKEEYLTSVGPICKENSLAQIADAVNEAYKSQLKFHHHIGKGIVTDLSSIEMITDKGFRSITNKFTINDSKLSPLERTNGDLKKKIGTLESIISKLTTTQEKMDELMKEQVN